MIKIIYRLFALLLIAMIMQGCQTLPATRQDGGPDDTNDTALKLAGIETAQNEIKALYTPADCFRSNFLVFVSAPGQSAQSVAGLLRVDNQNDRMRLVLTERFLGFTLSWITITNNIAYVSNPYQNGIQKVSLQGFELKSTGTNNIQLPFTLFQELLYGGLPAQLFDKSTKWSRTEKGYTAQFFQKGDELEYIFEDSFRLDEIYYKKANSNYRAHIDMVGKFYDTILPQSVGIVTSVGDQESESMTVQFESADFKAWCKDEYFPVK